MAGNFYATLAQVLPLLLLALIWDSDFLGRLRGQRRQRRRDDPRGVRFWTKPRVRVYTLAVATVVSGSTGITILVLAGLMPDSRTLRIALVAGVLLVLATLLTRICSDVIGATSSAADDRPATDQAAAGPAGDIAPPSNPQPGRSQANGGS